ncbi:MAG: sensor histidine kinase [Comamonadaceae bacterium]|nr:sensor histidine kinase [Comamonadaceae bacterium]
MLGIYAGLELALVVAAVLGAVMLRHRLYVYFAMFVVAGVLQRFALSGLLHQWWLDEHAVLADAIASSLMGLTAAAGAVFFATLFEYRRHHRRLLWVISLSALYMVLTALAPLAGLFGHLAGGASALLLVNLLLMMVPLVRHWRTGTLAVRLGVVGFLVYVGLVTLNVVSLLGLIAPSVELLRAAQTGSLALLFMLLLIIMLQTTRAQRDRASAEETAAQARAAEDRERLAREEQSYLVTMLAHEIRTPVAVIDAARQSLQVLDEQPTPERMLRHERIERAVQRMKTLMELALAQDRLEVSTWTHHLSAIDLVGLTKDVVPSLGPLAEERVSLHAFAGPCIVRGDERMLRFALLNLVDNALKYSPRDTPVTVSVEPAERGGTAGCLWRVDDLGQGIPEADLERVFHKYFRAAEATGTPGLGLGLYIVRQIVTRHHGSVVAAPGPSGTGTRFECWLPARATTEPKESPA